MDAKSSHGNHIYKSNGDGNSDQAKKGKEKNPRGDAIEEVKICRPSKNNIIASDEIDFSIFTKAKSEPSFVRNTRSFTSMGPGAYKPQDIAVQSQMFSYRAPSFPGEKVPSSTSMGHRPYEQKDTDEAKSYCAPSFHGEKVPSSTSMGSRPYERKVEDLISSSFVAVQKTFIVRPLISSAQKNINEMDEEEIPGEAAVCRYCFKIFEEENILKLKCKCTVAGLAHYACMHKRSRANENYNCDDCGQKLESMPVKLLHKKEVTNWARLHKIEHKKKKFFSFCQ